MDPLKIPLKDIPRIAGESISVVHDAINVGHLPTFLVGRRRFARPKAISDWVDFLEAESNAGRPVTYRPRSRDRAMTPEVSIDVTTKVTP